MSNSSYKYALWSLGERYVPVSLQIISTLILTRMIMPSDFSEVAIVTAITEILTLVISAGMSEGLIYNKNNSDVLYSSVFYANFGIALILYLILFGAAPSISAFYKMPRLKFLIWVAGLNMVFYSFSYIHRTIYSINLNFKTPATITLISSITGCCVGLTLAFRDFGVWALVFQSLTINLSQSVLFWFKNKWRPSKVFSWLELKKILPFSINVFLNNLVQALYDNIYTLLLGRFQPAKLLGFYNRMQSVVYLTTTNLSYSLERVYYPILARIKDDIEHLRSKYLQITRLIVYLSYPVLIILIGSGRDIIIIVLTEKWVEGYNVLMLLCCAFFFTPLMYINNAYMKLLNKTKVLFYAGLYRKIVGILILLITITTTMTNILLGIILTFSIEWLITSGCIQKYLRISVISQIINVLPIILVNVVVYLLMIFFNQRIEAIFIRVFVNIVCAFIVYFVWLILFKPRVYFDIKSLIRK